MRASTVSRRYARALFALADQQGALDAVAATLAAVTRLLADETVARVLTGPVARRERGDLLRRIADETGGPAVVRDFLLLLAERDRLRHLAGINAVFTALVDERRGLTRAAVRSAVPLARELLEEITGTFGTLTGKQVIASVQVDPALIGGVVVEVEGRVYDGSLRTQLERLHHQMATGG